mmetsp:Transcript_17287/g.46856  ORF Transcript_17287/g.46856 Transcript_17287/m.46856 type:complete len:254 (+) Transcript_17287:1461-2222(+)
MTRETVRAWPPSLVSHLAEGCQDLCDCGLEKGCWHPTAMVSTASVFGLRLVSDRASASFGTARRLLSVAELSPTCTCSSRALSSSPSTSFACRCTLLWCSCSSSFCFSRETSPFDSVPCRPRSAVSDVCCCGCCVCCVWRLLRLITAATSSRLRAMSMSGSACASASFTAADSCGVGGACSSGSRFMTCSSSSASCPDELAKTLWACATSGGVTDSAGRSISMCSHTKACDSACSAWFFASVTVAYPSCCASC